MARVVVPGIPHHITQRGNRRQQVFFCDADYQFYMQLMREHFPRFGIQLLAYCLMPNHVHHVMIPSDCEGLRRALIEVHRRFSRSINFRKDWRGYLWQGRFASFPMDEKHLLAAVRYIELNPVKAKLCAQAEQWRWSSASAHLTGIDDGLVSVAPMLRIVGDWQRYLSNTSVTEDETLFETHAKTGRPLGSEEFIENLERLTGRVLKKQKPGPKTNSKKMSRNYKN